MAWPPAAHNRGYAGTWLRFDGLRRIPDGLERCIVTETPHTRSRNASLGGLALQLVVFGVVLGLSFATDSHATRHLAWFILGGVPIWFVSVLVFRQRELAALEAMDLEALRREKDASGAGTALFDEQGGLGFRVAESRLQAMQRWFLPTFSLLTAVYLAVMGIYLWRKLTMMRLGVGSGPWNELRNIPIAMVVLAIVMLGTFLFSRYASGMARASGWQLLRGCGSYMLANALVITALLICVGVEQYAGVPTWEQALAFVIPVLMVVLALEMLANFVLDTYRPRTPGTEPRAAFDSRLLGLFAEPGGIAHSIAEAMNYQFGFQVSQTWFYKLLERAFIPLMAFGAVALWALTCIVVVQPFEHVIVERWGRQLNADRPLGPGLHWKLPWPIDVARAYNTGQLHQIHVGYRDFWAVPELNADQQERLVLLWTDTTHFDLEHFDFLLCPTAPVGGPAPRPAEEGAFGVEAPEEDKQPVHLIRMDVVVQYRIDAQRLDRFTQSLADPHRALRNAAWAEVGRYTATATADRLMGSDLREVGELLRHRVDARVASHGLAVVYVGVTNIHPEKTVAEAYRNIVRAEQEKVAAIRTAQVTGNQRLSQVAGDVRKARQLAYAVDQARRATEQYNEALRALADVPPEPIAALTASLQDLTPLFDREILARARLDRARERRQRTARDFELGLGQTLAVQREAEQAEAEAEVEARQASAALAQALAPRQPGMREQLGGDDGRVAALIQSVAATAAARIWNAELAREFTQTRLQGQAAETLARALAERWKIEMRASAEMARAQNERAAFHAAPEIYKTRRLIEVLVDGLKEARKFFLAFDPGDRLVRVRFVVEDEAFTDIVNLRPDREP